MAPRQYIHQEFPKRVWHPETGRFKDVASENEIPEGWLTRHPNDPVHALGDGPAPAALAPLDGTDGGVAMPPMSAEDRAGIMEELRVRKIPFNARASTGALASLLREVYARES